jgi:hypothetical protein
MRRSQTAATEDESLHKLSRLAVRLAKSHARRVIYRRLRRSIFAEACATDWAVSQPPFGSAWPAGDWFVLSLDVRHVERWPRRPQGRSSSSIILAQRSGRGSRLFARCGLPNVPVSRRNTCGPHNSQGREYSTADRQPRP